MAGDPAAQHALRFAIYHLNSDGGIHIARLGSVWPMAVLGFAGSSLHKDYLAFDPILPDDWTSMDSRSSGAAAI